MIRMGPGRKLICIPDGGVTVLSPGGGAAAATGWWLSGGIAAAECLWAHQADGAASYTASKVNLANPGTYDLTEGNAPGWDAVNGWTFTVANNAFLIAGAVPFLSSFSIFARVTLADGIADRYYPVVSRGSVFENNTNYDLGLRNSSPDKLFCYGRNGTTLVGAEANLSVNPINNVNVVIGVAWEAGTNKYVLYQNGTPIYTGTMALGADGGQNVLIGSPNTVAGQDARFVGTMQCDAGYDIWLSAAQAAAVSAAIAAL